MIYRDRIIQMVERYSDRISVIIGNNELTYRDINEKSNAIIHGLSDLGLVKEDKIALFSRNSEYSRELLWAAGKSGFVFVPVNGRLMPREASYVINNSDAKVLIISKEYVEMVESIRKDLQNIKHIFSIDPATYDHLDFQEYLKKYPTTNPAPVDLTEDDMLFLQYTSGTTGLPKGAIHTQGTANGFIELSEIRQSRENSPDFVASGEYVLHVLPLYSFAGTGFDIIYQWMGVQTIIMVKFEVNEMMQLIEKYKISELHIVPVILNFMLHSPDLEKYDLRSLKRITYGGSPMAPSLLKAGVEKFGPIFVQDLAATETGAISILESQDHIIEGPPEKVGRLASCGKAIPGVEVKILNESGQEVKPGEIGEIVVKGSQVMKGYWKMPKETEKTLRDGWCYTGDLATVDEEGYIYIKDRQKDMIISGGFNIYPFEVESVLMELPAILDAAVIGIPDDLWGESVCAIVVLKEGQKTTEMEIIEYVKSRIASYKKPSKVEFIDAIPRTLSGKILKKDLRKKYWEGKDRNV
jgi:long-chain acyl-CoA synthetase